MAKSKQETVVEPLTDGRTPVVVSEPEQTFDERTQGAASQPWAEVQEEQVKVEAKEAKEVSERLTQETKDGSQVEGE